MFGQIFKDLFNYKEEARGLYEETYNALTREEKIEYCHKHPHSIYAKDPKYNPELQESETKKQEHKSLSDKLKGILKPTDDKKAMTPEKACHKIIRNGLLDIYEKNRNFDFNNMQIKTTSFNGRLRPFIMAMGLNKVIEIGNEELKEFKSNVDTVENRTPTTNSKPTTTEVPEEYTKVNFKDIEEEHKDLDKPDYELQVMEMLNDLPKEEKEAYLSLYKNKIDKIIDDLKNNVITEQEARRKISELSLAYKEASHYKEDFEPVREEFTEEDFEEFIDKLKDIRMNESVDIQDSFLEKNADRILMIKDMIQNHELTDNFAFRKLLSDHFYKWMERNSDKIKMLNDKYMERKIKKSRVVNKKHLPKLDENSDFHCPICDKLVHFDMDVYNYNPDNNEDGKRTQSDCHYLGMTKDGKAINDWVCNDCYDKLRKPRKQKDDGSSILVNENETPIKDAYPEDITDTYDYTGGISANNKNNTDSKYTHIRNVLKGFNGKEGPALKGTIFGDGSVSIFDDVNLSNRLRNSLVDSSIDTKHPDWKGHFKIKMNKVVGDFIMNETYIKPDAKLTSLDGCPKEVDGDFILKNCSGLKTLKSVTNKENPNVRVLPSYVKGKVSIRNTGLETFEDLPKDLADKMNADDYLTNHKLKNLKGIPNGIKADFDARFYPNLEIFDLTELNGDLSVFSKDLTFNDSIKCNNLYVTCDSNYSDCFVKGLNHIDCKGTVSFDTPNFEELPKSIKAKRFELNWKFDRNKFTNRKEIIDFLKHCDLDVEEISINPAIKVDKEFYKVLKDKVKVMEGLNSEIEEETLEDKINNGKITNPSPEELDNIKDLTKIKDLSKIGNKVTNFNKLTDESKDIALKNKDFTVYVKGTKGIDLSNKKEIEIDSSIKPMGIETDKVNITVKADAVKKIGDNSAILLSPYEFNTSSFNNLKSIGNNNKLKFHSTAFKDNKIHFEGLESIGENCKLEPTILKELYIDSPLKSIGNNIQLDGTLVLNKNTTADLPKEGHIRKLIINADAADKYNNIPETLKIDKIERL